MTDEKFPNATCGSCGVTGKISRVVKVGCETIRGRTYEVEKVVRVCGDCGTEFEHSRDPDWRIEAFARFRADEGMVTPEQMVDFRKRHGLTQEEVAALLGWGDATLSRYERGSLQSAAHDKSLASLMEPGGLIAALEARSGAVPPARRKQLIQQLRVADCLLSADQLKAVRQKRGLTVEDADDLVQAKGRWATWESGEGLQSASADRLIRVIRDRSDVISTIRSMHSTVMDKAQKGLRSPGPLSLSNPVVKRLREELVAAKLKEDAVRKLLPRWWNAAEDQSSNLLPTRDFIASHFGLATDNCGMLKVGHLPEAKFKTKSGTSAGDVTAARAVATAVARKVAQATHSAWSGRIPDANALREQVLSSTTRNWVDFENLAMTAWDLGIPVVMLPHPPVIGKKMDGMVTFVEGRPVIVLTRNEKLSDWMLFVLAHELGHIGCQHLPEVEGAAVLDESAQETAEVSPRRNDAENQEETEANQFAQHLLIAGGQTLILSNQIPAAEVLAKEAIDYGSEYGISPGHAVLNAVRHTENPPFDLNRLGRKATGIVDEVLKRSTTQEICKVLARKNLTFSAFEPDSIAFLEKLDVI